MDVVDVQRKSGMVYVLSIASTKSPQIMVENKKVSIWVIREQRRLAKRSSPKGMQPSPWPTRSQPVRATVCSLPAFKWLLVPCCVCLLLSFADLGL